MMIPVIGSRSRPGRFPVLICRRNFNASKRPGPPDAHAFVWRARRSFADEFHEALDRSRP